NNLDSIGSYLLREKLINNPKISNKNKDHKKNILNLLDKNDEYSLTENMLSRLQQNLEFLRDNATCETKHFADEMIDIYNKITPLDGVSAFVQDVIRENVQKVVLKKTDNFSENNANGLCSQKYQNKTLRVQEKSIDDLFNITSELINVSEMYEYIQRGLADIFGSDPKFLSLKKNTEYFQSLSLQLQNKLSRIKRVSARNFYGKAQRVVYDITSKNEKKIKLDFQGENILIDKRLFSELENVFLHLVRNAVYHGIELPDQRKQMGKSEEGKIAVSFEETHRSLVIAIKDDGKGIFCQEVMRKAIEKKIISKNQAQKLMKQDIYNLLFVPGFSTVEHADEVSGRGVGLDIVKKQVAMLGGEISVFSEENRGTSIKLIIPKNISLNIFNGFVIQSCGQNFVLPLNTMGESFKVVRNQIESTPDNNEFISHHGKLYSLLRLNKILAISSGQDKKNGIAIVVTADDGDDFVLLVDEIIGIRQVVLKTISGLSYIPEVVYGAAVLGNSKVALVLDVKKFKNFNSKLRGGYGKFKNKL
ncbi:chemotaxis protein CheW, partial [bacterium]|nr:chemotaxis protein CheW [bacterium]